MKRLDNGEGNSPLISIRLPKQTTEQLNSLIASLPPHPVVGSPSRAMVLRAVIEAGIDAIAIRERIKLGTTPKPSNGAKAARKTTRPAKKTTTDLKAVHPRSRARAEKRAAARLAAGCTCTSRHVQGCKLYHATAIAS
jgi:predicted DNA-binding protein